MASTWKLTKKLKETHLSTAFLRGGSSAPSTDASRSNTIVKPPSSTSQGVDPLETPRASISNAGARTNGSTSRDATISTATERQSHNQSTARNPALLRVKVHEIHDLVLPPAVRARVPAWAFDPKSTRPPPIHLVLEYDKTQIILHAIGGTATSPTWYKMSSFDQAVENSTLTIRAYVRVPELRDQDDADRDVDHDGPEPGQSSRRRGFEDIELGTLRTDGPTPDNLYDLRAGVGSPDKTRVVGRVELRLETQRTRNQPLSIDDFSLLKVVGKGSFGKVMQVRKKDTEQIYALKTLRKAHVVSRSEVGHTLAERTVLAKIHNPFIVPLKFSFQSPEKLYLVLAFINGGELFHHLQREGRFDLNRARFYTAELLCALECLHEYNVIYRDLKPENILLDYTGHIALCDFGLCKLNMAGQEKTNTFCGTPEYLAPELLLGRGYTKVVDFWTLGVLFYEMLTGLPPFYDQDTNKMYHKILQNPLVFPNEMDQQARSLLTGLLERDPTRRLGYNGAADIKAHPFFREIDWKCLLNKKYAAPFLPSVASATDTSNFDQEFTSEVPMDSVADKDNILTESVQRQFGGWSYTNTDSKLASSGKW